MGLFDYYVPNPETRCPTCGNVVENWQGKHGPCLLLVWEQGKPNSTGDLIDAEKQKTTFLPERFYFTSECCTWNFLAEGRCIGGTWEETTVEVLPKNANSRIRMLAAKYGPLPS
jgi:hypothetical protein